jgi:hypothetical protein
MRDPSSTRKRNIGKQMETSDLYTNEHADLGIQGILGESSLAGDINHSISRQSLNSGLKKSKRKSSKRPKSTVKRAGSRLAGISNSGLRREELDISRSSAASHQSSISFRRSYLERVSKDDIKELK